MKVALDKMLKRLVAIEATMTANQFGYLEAYNAYANVCRAITDVLFEMREQRDDERDSDPDGGCRCPHCAQPGRDNKKPTICSGCGEDVDGYDGCKWTRGSHE